MDSVATRTDAPIRSSASTGRRRGHLPPLERRQRRIEDGLLHEYARRRSPAVREQLVTRFMPLARSLALRYRGGTEPLDDLVQVAALGLVKALDGFEPGRGKPFTAYAVPTMLGELRRHFRDNVWSVHLPRSLQERTIAVENEISRLAEELGRYPTPTQLGARLGLSEEEVLDALRADHARRTVSLDAPIRRDSDDPAPAVESVADSEPGYDRVEAEAATAAADLDEREWRVLRLRFEDGLNQYEIGNRLGVSQMQISRIMRRALHKLLDAVQGKAPA